MIPGIKFKTTCDDDADDADADDDDEDDDSDMLVELA